MKPHRTFSERNAYKIALFVFLRDILVVLLLNNKIEKIVMFHLIFLIGIDDNIREKLNNVDVLDGNFVDWQLTTADNSSVQYGMLAFGRSQIRGFIDCVYILYKLDFGTAPTDIVTDDKHSWTVILKTKGRCIKRRNFRLNRNNFLNLLRVKALELYHKENLTEDMK